MFMGGIMPTTTLSAECSARRDLLNAVIDAHALPEAEAIVYAAVFDAAERGLVCPSHEDLMELCDYSSTASTPDLLKRIEGRGLVTVRRFIRTREVRINATGRWTARDPRQKSETPQTPRGTHDSSPLVHALVDLGCDEVTAHESVADFRAILRLEKMLNRAVTLLTRRKVGMLLTEGNA